MLEARFNIQSNIVNNIPKLIEVFVKFYGEEYRDMITDKFNKLIVAGYYNPQGYQCVLSDEQKKAKEALIEEFKLESGITDKKKVEEIFGFSNDFSYIPLVNALDKDLSTDLGKTFLLMFINSYTGKEYTSLEDDEVKDVIEELKRLRPFVERTKEKYDRDYKPFFSPYEEYNNKLKAMEASLKDKYVYKYLEEIKDLLSDKDKDIINRRALTYEKYNMDCMYIYLGNGIDPLGKGFLEAFSTENEELLNTSDKKWIIDSIKDDRIKYFQKLGIKHNTYEEYMSDPKCISLIPDEALIKRITETKKRFSALCDKELFETLPHHKEILDIISNSDLLCDSEFTKHVKNNTTCIFTNFAFEDGTIKQRPMLFFDGANSEDAFDCRLIHELNHLFELNIIKVDGPKVTSICGWDIVDCDINERNDDINLDPDDKKRNYEMFNEIINEFIAQDICKQMHDDGLSISGDLKYSKNNSYTSYETLIGRFTRVFYERFKQDILESRRNGNIDSLLEKIGKDEFEEYNDMLRDFSERFAGMKIYGLLRDYKDKVENDDTKYLNECFEHTKELMKKFINNKALYEENNKQL